jgi:phospholipase A-2-activating protein
VDSAVSLMDAVVKGAGSEVDSETVFRYLVALGTILTLGAEVKEAANGIFDVRGALKHAVGKVKEPKIQRLVAEIEKLL